MDEDTEILGPGREFEETSWSLVRESHDRKALDKLLSAYWRPLYVFIRRQSFSNEEAKDLVQGFMVQLLERSAIRMADPARGKFRTFLLAALANYIANWQRATRRQKRGGARLHVSLDTTRGEKEYLKSVASGEAPERALDRAWARNLWQQALSELRGSPEHLEAFRMRLSGRDYRDIAAATGLEVAAAETAVHRLRQKLRETIESYIRQTVESARELESELYEFESLLL